MQFYQKIWILVKFLLISLYVIARATIDLLIAFIYLSYSLLFSPQGLLLIASTILGAAGYVIVQKQVTAMESIGYAWCQFQPAYKSVLTVADGITDEVELLLCVFNLFAGVGRVITSQAISIAIHCTDPENWIQFIKNIGFLVLSILESGFNYLISPLDGQFNIISTDTQLRTPWSSYQKLFDFFEIQANCQCSSLGDLFTFALEIFRKDNLGFAIHHAVNSGIALTQSLFNIILEFQFPDLSLVFDRLILTSNAAGDYIDDVLIDFIGLFTVLPPNPALGCTASRLVSVGIQAFAVLFNAVTTLANSPVTHTHSLPNQFLEPRLCADYHQSTCL